jgi:ADP-ribosylglycohydrolase
MDRSVDDIREVHVRNETSQNTVPESIICALEANSFEDAVRNAVSLGGDTDTMASIAGAIAEASFGVPTGIEVEVRRRLDPVILDMLDIFLQRTKPFCA